MAECPWPILLNDCAEEAGVDTETAEGVLVITKVVGQVSEMLSRWSGYVYGGCKTVRPLNPCGECRVGCCVSGDCIVLHGASEVTQVRMDGDVINPLDYHFDPARGTLCSSSIKWPRRDSRSESIGTLEVDVLVGQEPDDWALAVASELACEILKSTTGKKCRLPMNATMVSSQGVTIMATEQEIRYSIPSVMAWVNAVNPAKRVSPPRIFSPEARRARIMGR